MTAESSRNLRSIALALGLLLVAACRLPLDPESTSEEVTGGVLKVGLLMRPLDAPDRQALERIAARFDATPELIEDDPHRLFARLERGDLHLILGRLPGSTPFADKVALSDPFGELRLGGEQEDRVLALRQGENRFLVGVNRALKEGR
ncbi:enoyl-CoA hydratase [Sulfitobacter aestuarii]|uniref:Enoyl-CoA hydratase n=1 Tax=Sulfitobacter aestuarii TaxID=2161676 RepID=A0ABW5U2E8_9RHOB